jgi:hypothetical protein
MYSISKNDVKKLAQQIENLAKEIVTKVDQNVDILAPANELVRCNATFVFTLGEIHALENMSKLNNVTSTTPKTKNLNYHNVRDSRGRFQARP